MTPPSTPSGWPSFWVASIAAFLVSLDGTLLFAAFSALREGFPSATPGELSWVLNGYTVVYAAMLIPAGGLADRYGRKRVFLCGVALFLAASALCGLSGSVTQLVAARVLQAIGAALLMPSSLALVLGAFPISQRALVVGAWGGVGALAAAAGPGFGAWIVDVLGWQWAFYLNLPLGIATIYWGVRILRETDPPTTQRPLDWIGSLLLIMSVGAIALSIVQSRAPEWSPDRLGWVAGLGVIALVALVAWLSLAHEPLVPPELFRNRTYRAANFAALAFGIAFSMMFFAFFVFLMQIWGYDLPTAGLAITPGPLIVAPAAVATGRLASRYGHRNYLLGGSLLYAASGLWFVLVPTSEPRYWVDCFPGLILSGISIGVVMPSIAGAAVAHLPAAHYGVGSAFNQAIRQIGSVLGVALTVLLIGKASVTMVDFKWLYSIHVGLSLTVAAVALAIQTRPDIVPQKLGAPRAIS